MQESIAETLISKIRDRMSTLRIGPPLDKAIDIGAIVARVQLERIQRMVAQGVAEGATCWQPQLAMPSRGLYYPADASQQRPSDIDCRAARDFRSGSRCNDFPHSAEAVELANNTVYGLASCVWSENINVALQVAAQIKAGVVWVNCTNLFDAACGFGGYRESGYGREGGREGLLEYMELKWFKHAPKLANDGCASLAQEQESPQTSTPAIDRTVKLYIGGKQARPDSGYSMEVRSPEGALLGEAPLGNRKDIRNAVEAARKANGWAKATAHTRAQVLYYCAENLALSANEIIERLALVVGNEQAAREVNLGVERIFSYAAWADKFDGAVHNPPFRNIAIAMNEALGTVGVICPADAPLLGFLSLVLPLLAVGNTVIAIPSEKYPLIAGDLYQIFDTSDMPAGAINIVTGYVSQLLKTLAEHDDIDAIWCYGDETIVASAKAMSIGNLKQVWTNEGRVIDWFDPRDRGRTLVPGARHASKKHLGSRTANSGVRPQFAPILLQNLFAQSGIYFRLAAGLAICQSSYRPASFCLVSLYDQGGPMGIAVSPQIHPRVAEFIDKPRQMLINGRWVNAASGKTFPSYNPATGEVLAQVAEGDRADIDLAVRAARQCLRSRPVAPHDSVTTRTPHLETRRSSRAAYRGVRLSRKPRQRQAAEYCQGGGRPARRRPVPLHGGMDHQDRGQHDSVVSSLHTGREVLRLHPARAGGRGRPDHPLEFPVVNGGMEARSGSGDAAVPSY